MIKDEKRSLLYAAAAATAVLSYSVPTSRDPHNWPTLQTTAALQTVKASPALHICLLAYSWPGHGLLSCAFALLSAAKNRSLGKSVSLATSRE